MRHFRFGEFELDEPRRSLRRDGTELSLNPKAFDLLVELVRASGSVVTKDELLTRVWPDQFVEENNLSVHVSALRKVLGDGNGSRKFIATVPGKGYSFVAPLENSGDDIIVEQRTFERVIVEQTEDPSELLQLAAKPSPRWPLATATILVLSLLAGGVWWWRTRTVQAKIESIAVMPFTYEGGNADSGFLSDGLTESLINSLSRLPNLTVKARYSVFSYKDKEIIPANVASELSVQALLLGRVVERADQITLSLELIDAATGNHLWGESYQRKASELSTLQTDISRDVADKLRSKLAGNSTLVKGQTNNAEAMALYQKGRYFWNKRRAKDHEKAIELFQQALKLDPNFALAYAGLGDVYTVDSFKTDDKVASHETGRQYALKALEIEPDLAEAYTILAKGDWNLRDPANAERNFKRAIELNPNYASAREWHGEFLSHHGRHEAARAEINRAMELDPLSLVMMSDSAYLYLQARDYDACIAQAKKTLEYDRTWNMAIGALGACHEARGDYEGAIDAFAMRIPIAKTDDDRKRIEQDVALVRGKLRAEGPKGYWKVSLELTRQNPFADDDSFIAACLAQLGDIPAALDALEKAVNENEGDIDIMKVDPLFDPIRNELRFKALLARTRLDAEF